MSQEHVELTHRAYDAFNRRDAAAFLELMDADVEALSRLAAMEGGYHGHDGVRAYFAEVADVWDELRPYSETVETIGSDVVVFGGCAVRGRGSRLESDTPMAWVVTVQGGKITSHRGYRTSDEALEAAGSQ